MFERMADLAVRPRSAYVIAEDARWKWQHRMDLTLELRWSITFRNLQPCA